MTLSRRDPGQVLQAAFDDDTQSLRTTANFTGGTLEISINSEQDSVTVGDVNGNLATVTNGALNVNSNTTITGGNIDTTEQGLNAFKTSQYTIGTSPVQITPSALANRSSISLTIIATPNIPVYIGNSNTVSTTTGYPLYNGNTIELDLTPSGAIWAVSTITSQTVAALEIA